MVSELKSHLAGKGREPYLGIVHRLDKPVEGIMVFAKNKKAAGALSRAFQTREVRKRYLALVRHRPLEEAGRLEHFIRKNAPLQRAEIVGREEADAREALLSYRLLKTGKTEEGIWSLLEIELFTGRFHQIRAQLAHCGLPIRGDKKYDPDPSPFPGKEERRRGAIGLAAVGLEFLHPESKKRLAFSYTPQGEIWDVSGLPD